MGQEKTVRKANKARAAKHLGAAIVLAMVAAACSGSAELADPVSQTEPSATVGADATATAEPAGPTPIPMPTPPPVPGALAAVDVPVFDGDEATLPTDPEVRIGQLENGLTFYIRRNTAPGTRAELRLAVNAGSAVQDDDQGGVAHFLEHMLFNGTERYPANDLVAVLESFGSEFGPDVNAYTSIDETVYELSVPTDDRSLFIEAFDVLAEWASKATIDADEVIAERGVLLEEWRLRSQGVGGRIRDLYDGLLTPGTPYEGRLTIGNEAAIETITNDLVQRFYDDWYRPDLMAVVAVGDFDVDDVEQLIRERFADLTNPSAPREVGPINLADADVFAFARLADPEMPNAFIEVFYEGQMTPVTDVGGYRRAIAYSLATDAVSSCFADDVSRGQAPFLTAYPSFVGLARDLDAPSLYAEGPPEALEASLGRMLIELERLRRDGITRPEFDRALGAYRSVLEQNYAGRDTTQDFSYASEYVQHFLDTRPSLGWDDYLALETRLLDEMTPEYITAVYLAALAGRAPQVVVVGPEADVAELPTAESVSRLIAEISGTEVDERVDSSRDIDELMATPDPVPPIETSTNSELGARVLRFANGVTVMLKPTTIAENGFSVRAINPGGTSLLPLDDLAAAVLMADVVSSSGVGDLDQVELDRLLADQVAFVAVAPDVAFELIEAGGATEDAEFVLQLINQYLTAPRVEASALTRAVTEIEPFIDDPGSLPFLASTVALLDARFGGDRRFQILPPPETFASLTVSDIQRVYEDSLGSANGSVFAIAGDFDPAEMEVLVAQYLGTLPSLEDADVFVDLQPPPPLGVVRRDVRVGQDPQGEATVLITADFESDLRTDIELAVLDNVLSTRLRDRLREALGATYSPVSAIAADEAPDALIETFIQVSGDPARLDEIVSEVEAVLDDLRSGSLSTAELNTAREQVRRDFELVSNSFWIEQMLYAATHPGVTMLTGIERINTAASVSLERLNTLIGEIWPADQYIVVTLGPEN